MLPGNDFSVGTTARQGDGSGTAGMLDEVPWGYPGLPGPPGPGPSHSISQLPMELLMPFAIF